MLNYKDENQKYRNLVNGQWVYNESGEFIDIKSPIDSSLIGKVPAMTKDEVDVAVASAKKSQKMWQDMPLHKRADILYKAAQIIEEDSQDLSNLLFMEIAKDIKSAESEIKRTADFIRFTADTAKSICGESAESGNFPGFKNNKIAIVNRDPYGVVLAISPFNYPINLAASKIAPALVIGNTVVFKPATQGSLCGIRLADIFNRAGLPSGVLNTVTGRGSVIGDYIVTHDDVNFINFTGSTDVGKRISSITSMVPTLMELGGKDAAIVLEDADLDLAADNIISGAFSYSGQRCTAVKRVIAVKMIADQLVQKLKERVEKLTISDSAQKKEANILPLISQKAADFVESLIDDAKDKGAKLITGGNKKGNLIYPTLIDNVEGNMRIAWEEPFGPVLPIIRVENKKQALEISNESEYGLQGCVFTRNINDAFYIADKLHCGTVQINNKTERGPDNFPFLGVKASGIGVQGIRYSIESMSKPKVIVINLER